jgi:hypothetical protein
MSSIPFPKWPPVNLPSKTDASDLPDVSTRFTPPNWSQREALYAITYKTGLGTQTEGEQTEENPSGYTLQEDSDNPGYNSQTGYHMFVFDAIMRANHRIFAEVTQHPVQTGYNITDHIIMQPFLLTLEVAMSDAIAMYTLPNFTPMWGNNPSKSISAFNEMKAMMEKRLVVTVNTRLYTYNNMVLREVSVEDSHKTYNGGLAMVLTFQQIIVADLAALATSNRIQSIGETQQGTISGTIPDPTTVNQHTVTQQSYDANKPSNAPSYNATQTIPGASSFTSILQNIFSGPLSVQ